MTTPRTELCRSPLHSTVSGQASCSECPGISRRLPKLSQLLVCRAPVPTPSMAGSHSEEKIACACIISTYSVRSKHGLTTSQLQCMHPNCRCRYGQFHVVNNDYTKWEMYAVGGSASPTINSQGNRYMASDGANGKEVSQSALASSALNQ